jgi:hypothetical protein
MQIKLADREERFVDVGAPPLADADATNTDVATRSPRSTTTALVPRRVPWSTSSTPSRKRHVVGEVLRVGADSGEQAGLKRVHPVQA